MGEKSSNEFGVGGEQRIEVFWSQNVGQFNVYAFMRLSVNNEQLNIYIVPDIWLSVPAPPC